MGTPCTHWTGNSRKDILSCCRSVVCEAVCTHTLPDLQQEGAVTSLLGQVLAPWRCHMADRMLRMQEHLFRHSVTPTCLQTLPKSPPGKRIRGVVVPQALGCPQQGDVRGPCVWGGWGLGTPSHIAGRTLTPLVRQGIIGAAQPQRASGHNPPPQKEAPYHRSPQAQTPLSPAGSLGVEVGGASDFIHLPSGLQESLETRGQRQEDWSLQPRPGLDTPLPGGRPMAHSLQQGHREVRGLPEVIQCASGWEAHWGGVSVSGQLCVLDRRL